jgi:hypothetical protein
MENGVLRIGGKFMQPAGEGETMRNRLRSISIVTGLLFVLAFPVSGLAGGGTTAPSPTGSSLGKTTATIVGDAVQFRPCSFEATFAVSDAQNVFSLFQLATGRFPTYHDIRGNTLSGNPTLSGDSSTCDIDIWTSTVLAVDEGGSGGEASDELTFECGKDRNDIPTAPRFSVAPRFFGQQPMVSGQQFLCCFTVTLSSSTPGGERNLEFIQVSGDLPPGHSLSGDTISGGCNRAPTYISGDAIIGGNDVFIPPTWVSKWRTINNNNRCETSGLSTLTLTCNRPD